MEIGGRIVTDKAKKQVRKSVTPERRSDAPSAGSMVCPLSPEVEDPMLMPRIVQETLNNLDEAKESRKKFEVSTHLDDIHFRVKQALAHAGLSTDIHPTLSETEMESASINKPPGYVVNDFEEEQRQERAHQRSVLEMVRNCLQGCNTQQFMLGEICDWLDTHDNLLTYTVSVEELETQKEEAKQSVADIKEALGYASRVVGKIRALGYILMKEAGFFPDPIIKEKEKPRSGADDELEETDEPDVMNDEVAMEMTALLKSLPVAIKKDTAESIKVYEETALLSDPTLFPTAVTNVTKVVQKAVRAVAHNHEKQALRDALKQYKALMKVVDIQHDDFKQKIKQLSKLAVDVEEAQNATAVWKEEYEKSELRIVGFEKKISKLQSNVEELEHAKSALETEIQDVKTEHEQELEEMSQRRVSVVTFSSHNTIVKEASFGSRSLLKATESAINNASKRLQEEIDELKQSVDQRDQTIIILEHEVNAMKEENEKLATRLEVTKVISRHETTTTIEKVVIDSKFKEEMLKKIKQLIDEKEEVGRQLGRMKSEMHRKTELLQYQEHCIKELKDELGQIDVDEFLKGNTKLLDGSTPDAEVKRMVQRMQKDFHKELSRLKAHIEKEKSRHEASMRKQDNIHKEQILNTHKQSLHLLRSMNRFKDAVAQILDREGLHVGANDIRRMPPLTEDEAGGDPRMLLAQMAGSAVELLVTIELKLSQALMNKRLEIKDNNIAKKFATKELESQTELAHKAKHAADLLGEKLKDALAKLFMAESTLTEMRRVEDERHHGISDRYRKLMKQYMDMQSGMDKLQKKYRKTVKYKDRAMKSVIANKDSIAKLMQDQQSYISSIEEHVKDSRDEHRRQLALSINDQKHNLKLLDSALKDNKITRETHAVTAEILKKSMQLPLMKLRNLIQRYVAYRKYKDMKEQFGAQSSHHLLGKNRQEFKTLQQHLDQRLEKANMQWKAKCSIIDTRRKDLFVEMDQLFNYMIAETGILLIQPDPRLRVTFPSHLRLPRPPAPTIDSAAKTVTKSPQDSEASTSTKTSSDDSALDNTTQKQSTQGSKPVYMSGPRSDSIDLQGTKLRLQYAKEDLWHLPPITTDNKIAAIEVPHIVDIEVNQIMRAAKLALQRAGRYKRTYPVSNAEVFDYGNEKTTEVIPIAKVVPTHGHRCYGNRSLFSSDLESTTESSMTDSALEGAKD